MCTRCREQAGSRQGVGLSGEGRWLGKTSQRPHFLFAKNAGEALFPLDGIVAKETRKT